MKRRIRNIHFVGIGGCGMSGIAEILHSSGFEVTGSDMSLSESTKHLKKIGVKVFKNHNAKNIEGADVVVYSSAVKMDNVELVAAHEAIIPVIRRAEMLGELMRMRFSLAISGTHGKTSTTSMTGSVLKEGGLDPTIIVGGIVKHFGSGAEIGKGNYLVAEADEFDRSFLKMPPTFAVITTLEADHLDCYKDLDEIKDAFVEFCNKVPFYGCNIICVDEPSVIDIIPRLTKAVVTYGFSAQADYQARDRKFTDSGTIFNVFYKNEKKGTINLNVPGDYNVNNALAAVACGLELEIPFNKIAIALKNFSGVKRRFEIKGNENDIMVVDDYAHHPTEILVSLQGARETYNRRIIAVFQPHLYSRTMDFYKEFGSSFINADVLIITDIYPAREKPVKGVSGKMISESAIDHGHRNVSYIKNKENLPKELAKIVEKGDMVITFGAGDIWKYGEAFLNIIKTKK